MKYKKKTLNDDEGCILRSRIKLNDVDEVQLEKSPYDICVLPNDTIVVASFVYGITQYDKQFKKLNHIGYISGKGCSIISVTSNYVDKIYFANINTHEVMCLDFDFNIIKSIGTYGSRLQDQVSYPVSVRFHRGQLYVSDYRNCRIQVFNEDLSYSKTLDLNFKPGQICISNNIIAIKPYDQKDTMLSFYTLEPFKRKCTHDDVIGNISQVNSNFYAYCFNDKKLLCYSEDGVLIEDIKLKFLDSLPPCKGRNDDEEHFNGFIASIDDAFIFMWYDRTSIFKF